MFADGSDSENTNDPNNIEISEKKIVYISKGIPVYNVKCTQDHAAITGDITCNSYYKMDEDVKLLIELGVSL